MVLRYIQDQCIQCLPWNMGPLLISVCVDIKKGKQLFLSLKTTWKNRSLFHIFLLFTYGQHDDKGGTNVQIMDLTGMSTHCYLHKLVLVPHIFWKICTGKTLFPGAEMPWPFQLWHYWHTVTISSVNKLCTWIKKNYNNKGTSCV